MRVLLLAVLFVLCGCASSGNFSRHILALERQPLLAHSSFGIALYDLDRGRWLYRQQATRYFLAASTTKLLTEGAALDLLGTTYRFTTNVYAFGRVDARGTLHGDLVWRASGDPNISGRIRPNGTLAFENDDHSYDGGGSESKPVPGDPLGVLRDLAHQIRARGIRRVNGRVRVDDSAYAAGFPEAGTGAIVSPVMLNDNIVDVTVEPGAQVGDRAGIAISPQTPYVRLINRIVTTPASTLRGVSLVDEGSTSTGTRMVALTGAVPLSSPPLHYPYDVPSPRCFAEMAFSQALTQAGVTVEQHGGRSAHPPPTHGYRHARIVATHVSPPLLQDAIVTLKVSDNLHADTMPYIFGNGDLREGFARERRFLQRGGLDPDAVVQNDGLGADAYVQPEFMVRYLAYVRHLPFFLQFRNALPVLGVDGSLFNVQRNSPAAGHVFAKPGTWVIRDRLNGRRMVTSKGLAGYITTARGRHLAFCLYINNLPVASNRDAAAVAGHVLAQMAVDAYRYAP